MPNSNSTSWAIPELVERTFSTRNAAHIEHWRTKSFAAHSALGDFYDGVIDALDNVVEAHQGEFSLIHVGELPAQPKVSNIIERLEGDLEWVNENRKALSGGCPAIDNLIQELEAVYLKALYKLRNLS